MKKGSKILIIVAIIAALIGGGVAGVIVLLNNLSPRTVVKTHSGPNIHVEELSYFNGLEKIYGKVYLPQDTLGAKPVLICCAGLGTDSESWKGLCEKMAKKGWVTYSFDFRGGFPGSRSAGSVYDMSVKSEKADLEFVLQRIREEDFADPEHVYLIGHSQGALVAALVGAGFRREVAGMVLLAPAFNIPDLCAEKYPRNRDIPDSTFFINMNLGRKYFTDGKELNPYKWLGRYKNDVLILHGEDDTLVPISYAEKAAETFPNAELVRLPGVAHRFDGKVTAKMHALVEAFLDKELAK